MPYPVGIEKHSNPNNAERFFTLADGSFAIKLYEQEASLPEPVIQAALSKVGERVWLLDRNQCFIFKQLHKNKSQYYFILSGAVNPIDVNTYELLFSVNASLSPKLYITVQDNPFVAGCNSDYKNSIKNTSSIREELNQFVLNSDILPLTWKEESFLGDGTIQSFSSPLLEQVCLVFLDGVYQNPSKVSIAGNGVSFVRTPQADENITLVGIRKT